MKQSEQEMKEWAQQLNAVHLPRWEELPDIDLYMDQVMTLMDRYLDPVSYTHLIKNWKTRTSSILRKENG